MKYGTRTYKPHCRGVEAEHTDESEAVVSHERKNRFTFYNAEDFRPPPPPPEPVSEEPQVVEPEVEEPPKEVKRFSYYDAEEVRHIAHEMREPPPEEPEEEPEEELEDEAEEEPTEETKPQPAIVTYNSDPKRFTFYEAECVKAKAKEPKAKEPKAKQPKAKEPQPKEPQPKEPQPKEPTPKEPTPKEPSTILKQDPNRFGFYNAREVLYNAKEEYKFGIPDKFKVKVSPRASPRAD